VQSDFSRDLSDPDQPVKDAAKDRPGQPIKVRIQPMLLHKRQYVSWKQVRWTLDCDNVAEALATRDAMEQFFQALARIGPDAVRAALSASIKDAA
jgi:hypothetical protein